MTNIYELQPNLEDSVCLLTLKGQPMTLVHIQGKYYKHTKL